MMRHRYDQALALAERSVALHEQFPPGHGLAVALATLGQICVQLGDAQRGPSRCCSARSKSGASPVPRDDGRDLRLARADPPDPRRLRRRPRATCGRRARPTATTASRRRAGTTGRCGCSTRGSPCAAGRSTTRSREPTRSSRPRARRPPTSSTRSSSRPTRCSPPAGTTEAEQRLDARRRPGSMRASTPGAWGEFLRVRGEWHAQMAHAERGLPRSRAEQQRVRAARRALRGGAQPPRARPLAARAGARSIARAVSRPGGGHLRGARRRARSRGRRRRRARSCRRPAPASSSAPRPMPTTRSCGGSWTPRRCPSCWRARPRRRCSRRSAASAAVLFVAAPAAASPRRWRPTGCDADGGARAGARGRRTASPPAGVARARGARRRDATARASSWCRPRARAATSAERRLRMIVAVARQGFELCAARERPARAIDAGGRAPARAAAARLPLRERGDAARRRIRSSGCRATT